VTCFNSNQTNGGFVGGGGGQSFALDKPLVCPPTPTWLPNLHLWSPFNFEDRIIQLLRLYAFLLLVEAFRRRGENIFSLSLVSLLASIGQPSESRMAQPRVLKIDQQTSIRQPESHLQRPVAHVFGLRVPASSFSHEIPLVLATSTLG